MPRKSRGRPRKKIAATKQKIQMSASRLREAIRSIRWSESYTSLLMGIVVVVVAVLFIVSFLKQTHHIQQTSSISTVATPHISPTAVPSHLKSLEKTYTVKAGDDLWHIAEKYYNSGNNWVAIAKANNLSDPSMIFSGNVLIIPTAAEQTVTTAPTPEVGLNAHTITGEVYTVQKGDNLWSISLRAYADGYQWTKIARANNLSNPDLIFSGNILKIPR